MTGAGSFDVRVFPDKDSMSRACADLINALAIADPVRSFSMVLSGGSTPAKLYNLLADSPYRESIPWPRIHVFWTDERCVPQDHPDSNFKLAFDVFLSRVPLSPRNIHRIRGEEEPAAAAQAYEEELRNFFGKSGPPVFDVVLLGAGEDGHTASLFPGSSAIRERKRLVLPVCLDHPERNRITLTIPVLNNASRVVFLVAGRKKAGIVHEIIEDGNPKGYPAGMVCPVRGSLTWLLDREAASALSRQLI